MGDKIGKLVYYDTLAVTDYITIMLGGELEEEEIFSEEKVLGGSKEARVELTGKAKLQNLLKQFLDVAVSMNANADMWVNSTGMEKSTVKYTLKNTILTNFMDYLEGDQESNIELLTKCRLKERKIFEKVNNEDISNFILLVEDKGDKAGEKIFRFNKKNFWDGYFVQDILIMDLDIYAVKVGERSLWEIVRNSSVLEGEDPQKKYEIYDVLLAGIGCKVHKSQF